MNIGCVWIIFLAFFYSTLAQDESEERINSELQLADYDLADAYDEISGAYKNYLLNISEYKRKVQLEKNLGEALKNQSKFNKNLGAIPDKSMRIYDLLTKTGNFLLPREEYDKLVDFFNENEDASWRSKISKTPGSIADVDRQGYLNAMATERNKAILSDLWSSWQNIFVPNKEEFLPVLNLLKDALTVNEEESVQSYWESQSEYSNGYNEAEMLWEKVKPLYKKLHDFVKMRLSNYYGLSKDEDCIPVYLLGSNFGNDWSNIADIVLPHPYLYSEVNKKLKEQSVKSIYKLAEGMTKKIDLGTLGKYFWKKSNFSFSSCEPRIFGHCNNKYKYTEILTCDKLDFTMVMDIHETVMNMVLRNRGCESFARRKLRYSAVDESLHGLGSLIAIQSLSAYGWIPEDKWTDRFDDYNIRNTALLITALRVLPRLPYYLLADTWRLKQLESEEDYVETWWTIRRQMQDVTGNTNAEVDFLGDPFISSNKPYLSKFLGIFLQFQIYDHYNKYYSTENGTIVDFIREDEQFIKFIEERPDKSWLELINFYFNIDKISPDALLEYFEPLESYLEQAIYDSQTSSLSTKELNADGLSAETDTYSTTEIGLLNITIGTSESVPYSSSHEKIWILLGIGIFLLLALLLIIFIKRLRRRKRTNNRRFET